MLETALYDDEVHKADLLNDCCETQQIWFRCDSSITLYLFCPKITIFKVEETPQEMVRNWSSTQKGQFPYIVVKSATRTQEVDSTN